MAFPQILVPWLIEVRLSLLVMIKSHSAGLASRDRVSHSSISMFVNAPEISSWTFYSSLTQLAVLYHTANAAQCYHALHASEEFWLHYSIYVGGNQETETFTDSTQLTAQQHTAQGQTRQIGQCSIL